MTPMKKQDTTEENKEETTPKEEVTKKETSTESVPLPEDFQREVEHLVSQASDSKQMLDFIRDMCQEAMDEIYRKEREKEEKKKGNVKMEDYEAVKAQGY